MNLKNVTAGVCTVVMALAMLPAMPVEVHAAENARPVVLSAAPEAYNPESTATATLDYNMLRRMVYNDGTPHNVIFSVDPFPGVGNVPEGSVVKPLNSEKTIYGVHSGWNRNETFPSGGTLTVYAVEGGGVFAPNWCNGLFNCCWHLQYIDARGFDMSHVPYDEQRIMDYRTNRNTYGMFELAEELHTVICRSTSDMNQMRSSWNCLVKNFRVQEPPVRTYTIPINETTFPDENFRNWVLTNVDGKNGAAVKTRSVFMRAAPAPSTKDGMLDNKEQQATGIIDANTQGIKNLRGIEHFPNLRTLDVSNNDLSELNLSNNTKLENVNTTNNPKLDKIEANESTNGKLNITADSNTKVEYTKPFITQNSGDKNNIPVTLKTAAHNFSVTVPTSLPIAVAADGTVTCAQSSVAAIINNTEGPVEVTNVTLTGAAGWEIVPPTTAMESEAVNAKKLAMTIMGYETNAGGLDISAGGLPTLNGNASHPVEYTAKLPTQVYDLNGATVANVVFTIGWHEVV